MPKQPYIRIEKILLLFIFMAQQALAWSNESYGTASLCISVLFTPEYLRFCGVNTYTSIPAVENCATNRTLLRFATKATANKSAMICCDGDNVSINKPISYKGKCPQLSYEEYEADLSCMNSSYYNNFKKDLKNDLDEIKALTKKHLPKHTGSETWANLFTFNSNSCPTPSLDQLLVEPEHIKVQCNPAGCYFSLDDTQANEIYGQTR